MNEPHIPPPDAALAKRQYSVVLALGFFSQLAQILVFRELLALCHGAELLFGVVLASSLAWTALGSALGLWLKRLSRRPASGMALALCVAVSGPLLAGEIILARVLSSWGALAAGQTPALGQSAALAALVTAPAALVSGALFILALENFPGLAFRAVYVVESCGAVLGGLAFTFVLVHFPEPLRAAALYAIIFCAAAWCGLKSAFWPRALLALGAAGALALACLPLEALSECWRWQILLPGHQLLEWRESPYGRVCALARPGSAQIVLTHNGAPAAELEKGPTSLNDRQFADLCASLHPLPKRAVLVGGTLGLFPEELLRHHLAAVDALELDPALLEIARKYRTSAQETPGLARLAADGRNFIKNAPAGSYDLVIISAGDADNPLANRYYTVEFFREAERCLADGGLLVLSVPVYGAGAEYTGEALARRSASIWRALKEIFPAVRAAPINGHLLAAAKGRANLSLEPAVLGKHWKNAQNATPELQVEAGGTVEGVAVEPEDYFQAIFGGALAIRTAWDGPPRQTAVENLEAELAAANTGANRDTRPVAVAESLTLDLEVRGLFSSAENSAASAALLRAWTGWLLILPLAGVLLWAIFAALSRRGAGNSGICGRWWLHAFVIGVFGLAVEVGLLSAYQNARGHVYSEIGGLTASFMAGLALGAQAPTLFPRTLKALIWLTVCMAAFTIFLPLLTAFLTGTAGLPQAAGFWIMMILAGIFDGAAFSLLAALTSNQGGWTYASDLFGAALGGLLCGTIWIPFFGLNSAMYMVAALLLMALPPYLVSARRAAAVEKS